MATRGDHKGMNLLELPVDILKEIIKNLTHTNDLTSVALAHSALHRFAIPNIYSRFDIVWPDGATAGEPRGGVDALTYGLATLTMADDLFGDADWQHEKAEARGIRPRPRAGRRRRGNHYAQYIRKFSLGNGPSDWVEDYLISKEQGKMLGTLVALALPRMRSLESFVWDMPTGILSDVWTSLSYLGDRATEEEPCRLEKVWIRYHRNDSLSTISQRIVPIPPDPSLPRPVDQSNALSRVEWPSFSALPPLRSLSVVDIDELQYLDEMSVLIGKSLDKLRELRVGIAAQSIGAEWAGTWDGDERQQIDYADPVRSTATIGGRRRGGVLGVLASAFLDLKQLGGSAASPHGLRRRSGPVQSLRSLPVPDLSSRSDPITQVVLRAAETLVRNGLKDLESAVDALPTDNESTAEDAESGGPVQSTSRHVSFFEDTIARPSTPPLVQQDYSQTTEPPCLNNQSSVDSFHGSERYPRRLNLETLELERITLYVPALLYALEWSRLTSLTLLDCRNTDQLWSMLMTSYGRTPLHPDDISSTKSTNARRKPAKYVYPLNIHSIHLNSVTTTFLNFVIACLAPNSLQSIFLQDFSGDAPTIDIDQIFTTIVKRHKTSMQRLVIDSSKRLKKGALVARSLSWKHWAFTKEHLRYITNGNMPSLKELGVCIDYSKQWPYFIQHISGLPRLRSLYIPRYAAHSDPPIPTPKELALYLLEAVSVNRDVELCYVGVYDKCFELMEGDPDSQDSTRSGASTSGHGPGDTTDEAEDDDEDDEDDEDDDDDDDDDDDGGNNAAPRVFVGEAAPQNNQELLSDSDGEDEDDDAAKSVSGEALHIREILFYDDKVPIFRARHGRL